MFKKGFFFFWMGWSALALSAQNKADSIITEVIKFRDLYGEYIREYDAQVYIKGNTEVINKNRLGHYAPDFLFWNGKDDHSFVEAMVGVHYTAPNHFTQHIQAINGSRISANDIRDRLMHFLNINIYHPTIFNDRILFPGINNIFKYYTFQYMASIDTLGHTLHQIRVRPKIRSQKLLTGDLYVVDGSWSIFRIHIRGKWELFNFRVETQFGMDEQDFLLPLHSSITFRMKVLGNQTEHRYFAQFNYQSIKLQDQDLDPPDNRSHYDLSNHFSVYADSIPFVRDSTFWAETRPISLSDYEQSLRDKQESLQKDADSATLNKPSWNFTKGLITPRTFEYNDAKFTYSGLLNPFKLAYSKLDGILYWQQIKIRRSFDNGMQLSFRPNLGILFQRKQVYFSTPASWLFAPKRLGELEFNFENRNQSYTSTTIEQIKSATQDGIRLGDFNMEYYKHFQTSLTAKYELANGLLFSGRVYYDWYFPVRDQTGSRRPAMPLESHEIDDENVIDLIQNQYRIFTPTIGLRWTPGQFYRINGKRKEYLHSYFPSFYIEYAHGMRAISGSRNYNRIEIDIQQKISLGLMRSLHYYVGAGWFSNTQSAYFADFSNFRRKNIPQSWNDPIGGTFHILSKDWYSASNRYAQVHFMYESPFSILRWFRRLTMDIVTERIYVSQLYTPLLPCYTEIGYGFGNFMGNAGLFVSFNRGRYEAVGAKIVFEL